MGRPGLVVLTILSRAAKSTIAYSPVLSVIKRHDRSPEILVAVMTGTVR
jgi:hypothetical protein